MQLESKIGKQRRGFTLVELLTVMTIIGILASLVLGTFKYVQEKAARSRAEAEIKAMEAALESYKADNGAYPDAASLNASSTSNANPSGYPTSALILYRALSGDTDLNRQVTTADGTKDINGTAISPPPASPTAPKIYFEFKPNQLSPSGGTGSVAAIADPWGNSYGYSTINQTEPAKGYNPTFDLWSTGGKTGSTANDLAKWIKNW